jgi:hypothetical protein
MDMAKYNWDEVDVYIGGKKINIKSISYEEGTPIRRHTGFRRWSKANNFVNLLWLIVHKKHGK